MGNSFLVVKPEGIACCYSMIETYLNNHGFRIEERQRLAPWSEVAHALYPKPEYAQAVDAWLATLSILFPQHAGQGEYWRVHKRGMKKLEQFEELGNIKHLLRKEVPVARSLSVLYENKPAPAQLVHFALIHVPDPYPGTIKREFKIIQRYSNGSQQAE